MKLFCPKCGAALAKTVDGHFECKRGRMPLAHHLEQRLIECFVTEARRPREPSGVYKAGPPKIGGTWFCPGCGVMTTESTPGDVRCPKCSRSLSEFVYALVERHPHLNQSGKWT
jgi:tRNA(Ile2) C34 agmatinyltransferase TiaS